MLHAYAAGQFSKKLLKHREDGEALNGARDQAVPAEADLEAQTVQGGTKKGMILPFIRLAITFRDIHYYVPMPEVGQRPPQRTPLCQNDAKAQVPLPIVSGCYVAGSPSLLGMKLVQSSDAAT